MFFLKALDLARALFYIIPWSGCFNVKEFCNLVSVFAIVKRFSKLLKILGSIATFYLIRIFPLSFAKPLLTAIFQNIAWGLFCMTFLQKRKVGKKKVLGGSSFDSLFLIVSLTSSSIKINI